MNDTQLLDAYVKNASDDAFAQLVERYIPLVYSIALRQMRDAHQADDVTQAVFMVLAQKAGSIRDPALLASWLINTTRFAASNARKYQARRRRHEQRAAAMKSISYVDETPAPDTSRVLDTCLSSLNSTDRAAVVLRYVHGKSVREVGADLGISEQTAQKRIGRALDRMRHTFARHGIATPADAIEAALSGQFSQPVPAALLYTVLTSAFNPHAASAAAIISKATCHTLRVAAIKPLIGAAIAASVMVAVVAQVIPSTTPAARAQAPVVLAVAPPNSTTSTTASTTQPASDSAPLSLPATSFILNTNANAFELDSDDTVHRVTDSSVRLHSDTSQWGISGSAMCGVDIPARFLGKRIRYSAWVKSDKLANWGGLMLYALAPGQRVIAIDDMGDRPITGTTDWKKMEIVCDLSRDTGSLMVGLGLHGSGSLWMDGAQIEIVDSTVPITDNQIWHCWSFSRTHYSQSLDASTARNGHPTICLQSSVAKAGEWFAWDHDDRHIEQYLGKRLRITAWIKTENVTANSGFSIRVLGPDNRDVQKEISGRTIKGSTDWKKYTLEANVPDTAQRICSGVRLCGKGKLWLDDVQYEVLDAKP